MLFASVTEPPPTGLVTTTPSRIGVLPEKLTGVTGTLIVSQKSSWKPVHLSVGSVELDTTAVPKVSTPATAPVTTAPAAKPVPVMVMVVAVPSRSAFGVVDVGEVTVGAASTQKVSVTTPEEPPLVF